MRFVLASEPGKPVAAPHGNEPAPFAIGTGCNAPINAAIEGPDGKIYVGGEFSQCGDVVARGIARFDPSTQQWSPLILSDGTALSGGVSAFAIHQGRLYLGGNFSALGHQGQHGTVLVSWHDDQLEIPPAGDLRLDYARVLHSRPEGLYVAGDLYINSTGTRIVAL